MAHTEFADLHPPSVGPKDATGFQQLAIGVHDLGTDGTRAIFVVERCKQSVEPASSHLHIVIEEQDVAPVPVFSPDIACFAEEHVPVELDQFDLMWELTERLALGGCASIIDDDDLVEIALGIREDRLDAVECEFGPVQINNDDGDLRVHCFVNLFRICA